MKVRSHKNCQKLVYGRFAAPKKSSPEYFCLLGRLSAPTLATAPLDVRDCEADFVVVSFAKLLGYPQVGGLLIRRPAGYALAATSPVRHSSPSL